MSQNFKAPNPHNMNINFLPRSNSTSSPAHKSIVEVFFGRYSQSILRVKTVKIFTVIKMQNFLMLIQQVYIYITNFDVLLTVHLSIFLVINQLNIQSLVL